jgi:hypothetical protein
MTRRIEPSRRHGPFDPRYLRRSAGGITKALVAPLDEAERLQERHGAVLRDAVQAWEGEGGTAP